VAVKGRITRHGGAERSAVVRSKNLARGCTVAPPATPIGLAHGVLQSPPDPPAGCAGELRDHCDPRHL